MLITRENNRLLFAAFVLLALVLASCGSADDGQAAIESAWELSAHADGDAGAFSRWNDDDPAEIPENCAKCHSTTGYHDYLGADGSNAGQVDKRAPVGTTVECDACHDEVSREKDAALMPSGTELSGLDGNSNCFECHQGRASSLQIIEAIEGKARALGCCKLTLEVLENNHRAFEIYKAAGFAQLTYQEEAGGALFLAKSLDSSTDSAH